MTRPAATSCQTDRRVRYWAWLAVAIGVAVHVPSLWTGFFCDDYVHQIILDGGVQHDTLRPWNLYDFGDARQISDQSRTMPGVPWWTSPDWKVRFVRPLSSASIWFDHTLYGQNPIGYHITSLLLFTVLLVLLHSLYRRFGMPASAAALAVLLFAVEDSTVIPIAWIANRNALLALILMSAAVRVLAGHGDQLGVPSRWRIAVAISLGFAACLCKESGISTLGLIVLYMAWAAWHTAERSLRGRAVWASVAALAVAGVYVTCLAWLGAGANSVAYPTPWGDPTGYFTRGAAFLPVAAMSMISVFPLSVLMIAGAYTPLVVGAATVLLVPVVWVIWRYVRPWRASLFFLGWVLLAVLPQAGTDPTERLLFAGAAGGSALVAMCIYAAWRDAAASGRRLSRTVAILLCLSAGLLSALQTLWEGTALGVYTVDRIRRTIATAEVGPVGAGVRDVFPLQVPNEQVGLLMTFGYWAETGDRDVRFWPMQYGRRSIEWTRVDDRTFTLRTLDHPFGLGPIETVFLSDLTPPAPGTTWPMPGFSVTAVDSDRDGLKTIQVRLDEPMDSPRYRFLAPDNGRLISLPPPAVGESIVLAPAQRLHLGWRD